MSTLTSPAALAGEAALQSQAPPGGEMKLKGMQCIVEPFSTTYTTVNSPVAVPSAPN